MATDPNREEITIAPDFRPRAEQPAWRQDFPIDWPDDHYVERRDFVKFLVLTSAAFVTGQLWILGQRLLRRFRSAPPGVRIASVEDLAIGGALSFRYPTPQDPCLLVRLGATEFVAYSQKCTHLSCAVVPRPAQGIFYCPCHEGRFDIKTGAPIAGPPRRPLPRVVLEVQGRDIYARAMNSEAL